jgi:acetoin utilization protein AcuC
VSKNSAFIYSPQFLRYKFTDEHPFNPKRLEMTFDLLSTLGLVKEHQIVSPRPASDEELMLVHDPVYIDAVKRAPQAAKEEERKSFRIFGLNTEDIPLFPDMHEATRLVVGGTILAADLVMEGTYAHAFNMAGGLHHAHRRLASGFCIYNDIAVAIAYVKKKYGIRIAYVDTDAHHGDGVQWIFYDDPDVLTISLHETGKYLFPGTGAVSERGIGRGYGYSFNLPLEAYTEDDSFLECLISSLTPLLLKFKPDLIISQHGCDAHRLDPLAHLATTTRVFREIPKFIHELAHEVCEGRLVAVGGGGYDIWRVVPRAWTLLWAELSEHPLPDKLPSIWREKWESHSPFSLPDRFIDPDDLFQPIPRRKEIEEKNRMTLHKALKETPFLH